jgi:ATP-dependent RNA helicase SUPV3L1/SUV3
VCTVPDFRKLMLEVHADFLAELFVELTDRASLRDTWIDGHVKDLERGIAAIDVDELVARIAAVRTWTYVTNRTSWLGSSTEWQERTRLLEDRLSDALHERLVLRFVDAKRAHRPRSRARAVPHSPPSEPRLDIGTAPPPPSGHPFAALSALRARLESGPGKQARHVSSPTEPSFVEEVIEAAHAELVLDEAGQIRLRSSPQVLARVVRGSSIARPDVNLLPTDTLGAGARSRLLRRLLAFARDVVGDLLGGTQALAGPQAPAALRGLIHRLEQGLGTALRRDVNDVLDALAPGDRAALEAAGTVFGRAAVFVTRGLTPEAIGARVALASAWFELGRPGRLVRAPSGGSVSFAASRGVPRALHAAIGFPAWGARAVRADVLERVLAEPPDADEAKLASWIGASIADLRKVLRQASTS